MKMYNISSTACVHAELLVLSDSLRPVAGEAPLSMVKYYCDLGEK